MKDYPLPKKLPIDITEEEFTRLLVVTKQMKHKIAFLFGWGSGLRISEILNLKPNDIDFERGQVNVLQGKGKKDRVVPIPKGFKKRHMIYIPIGISARALQKSFKLYAEKSGLLEKKPKLRFHSLRHGFASSCVRKGINLYSIQKMLGHGTLNQTQVYLWLAPKEILNEYKEKF